MRIPALSSHVLFHVPQQGAPAPLGTCFTFRQLTTLLTASHCVPDVPVDQLRVALINSEVRVTSVYHHPTADVAALTVDGKTGQAFRDVDAGEDHLGEEWCAFGYPEAGFGEGPAPTTPRFLRGYYQRFFRHDDGRHKYWCGELSAFIPPSFSGAAIFRCGSNGDTVQAIATRNFESYTIADSEETVERDGTKKRTEVRRIVRYGLAFMLREATPWLNEVVPLQPSQG